MEPTAGFAAPLLLGSVASPAAVARRAAIAVPSSSTGSGRSSGCKTPWRAIAALGALAGAAGSGRPRRRSRVSTRASTVFGGADSETYQPIDVELPDGKKITIEARSVDTVSVLQAVIELETGVDKEQQLLSMGDTKLTVKDATMLELGVQAGAVLKLEIVQDGDPDAEDDEVPEDCMRIIGCCQVSGGRIKKFKINAPRADPVKDLKILVLEKVQAADDNFKGFTPDDFFFVIPQEPLSKPQSTVGFQLRPVRKEERLKELQTLEEQDVEPEEEIHLINKYMCEV